MSSGTRSKFYLLLSTMIAFVGCQKESAPTQQTGTTPNGVTISRGLDGKAMTARYENSQPTDADLAKLAKMSTLREIFADAPEATDASIEPFTKLKNLKKLSITSGKLTGSSLDSLSGLKNLQYLDLSGNTDLDEENLSAIQSLASLQSLCLNNTPVTENIVGIVKSLPNLIELRLIGSQIDDAGIAALVEAQPNLTHLSIGSSKLTDAAGESVAQLKKLQVLEFVDSQITDRTLEMLSSVNSLEVIQINQNSNITDTGIFTLGKLPMLTDLDVSETNFTGQGFKQHGFPMLAMITAMETKVMDEHLAGFKGVPNLGSLKLEGTAVTKTGVRKVFSINHQTAVSFSENNLTVETDEGSPTKGSIEGN